MRVIAGAARGVPLRPPSSGGTRPIADRAKEALFSILMPRLPGCAFLDLFGGTGAVGIEALSRGARRATFVERDHRALDDLRFNLERTRLADGADVVAGDVFRFLDREPSAHDVVFVGPPQWQDLWPRTVARLDAEPGWLAPGGTVVVQCDPREIADIDLRALERTDVRTYGNVALLFFERAGDA